MIFQRIFSLVQNFKSTQRSRFIFYHVVRASLKRYRVRNNFIITTPVTSLGLWGLAKKNESNDNSITNREVLIAKADALFENQEYQKIYNILTNYKDNKDVEILWRLSRALYHMAKTASDVEAKKMIYEAYDLIMTALNVGPNNWAVHKWIAILTDSKTNYEGMKEKIKTLETVKNHMIRASELNPKDATTLYMIGNWCYSVSDLAWYQKKIAAAIFGKVPDSSFEEALKYLLAAEQMDPMFYSHNLLLLGKTYLKLSRKEEAIKYLKQTVEYPVKNDDDLNAKHEATKILASI